METYGPEHDDHYRVEWPDEFEDVEIQISTAFRQFLCHNDPPSESMQRHVRSTKEKHLQKSEEIDDKITELYDRIDELEWEREQAKKVAFACDVILSPFRRLPDDIIYRIFREIFETRAIDINSSKGEHVHMPSRLSQTCKSISNVAHAPNLWQKIHCSWKPTTQATATVERIKNLSPLAGSLPIHITFDDEHGYTCQGRVSRYQPQRPSNDNIHDRIGDTLRWMLTTWEHRHQWNIFTVTTCNHERWLHLIREIITQTPDTEGAKNVQGLRLQRRRCDHCGSNTRRGRGSADVPELTQFVACFPAIRCLSYHKPMNGIERILVSENNVSTRATWSTLTSTVLCHRFTTTEWTVFLQLCPNLQKGQFNLRLPPPNVRVRFQPSPTPYVHRHMQQMYLRYFYCPGIADQIFSAFADVAFPALESLHLSRPTVDITRLDEDQTPPEVDARHGPHASNFTGVFPSLRSLILGIQELEVPMMLGTAHLLSAIPSLTHLRVALSHAHIGPFTELVQGKDGKSFPLPNVETLELEFSPEFSEWPNSGLDSEFTEQFSKIRESIVAFRSNANDNSSVSRLGRPCDGFKMEVSFTWSSVYRSRNPTKTRIKTILEYFLKLRQEVRERDLGIILIDTKSPDSYWTVPNWSAIETELMKI